MLQRSTIRDGLARIPSSIKYLSSAIFGGVIGNAAYAALQSAFGRATSLSVLIPWSWFIAAFELLAIIVMALFIRRLDAQLTQASSGLDNTEAQRAQAASTVKLDNNLFPLLLELVQTPADDRETAFTRLVYNLIQDLTEVVGAVPRGMLLRPEGDYLVPWIPYEMPQHRLADTRFYVGNDTSHDGERGVAGTAFTTRFPQRVRMYMEHGEWKGRHFSLTEGDIWEEREERHRTFTPSSDPARQPPYQSFVALPIIGSLRGHRAAEPAGVLCLDSQFVSSFDAPETLRQLLIVVDRLLIAIAAREILARP